MNIISGSTVITKSWCPNIEEGALKQIGNLSSLPFAFHHIAVMPDCHQGYGMPIGGVLATQKVVIPNAVGVDIGCGMCAIKTPWHISEVSIEQLKQVMSIIREEVPVGMRHHKVAQDESLMPSFPEGGLALCSQEYQSALYQLGTLGGGNHFIEIQKDTEGFLWIMLHSGSRNLGFKTAKYYNDLAKTLNGRWYSHVPKEWELAFLPWNSMEGMNYINEMNYCTEFALANRKLMMERIAEAFYNVLQYKRVDISTMINIAHNYAKMENHFGENVMVHRKGATSARLGEIGIIPGSQGTKSYIVRGLGNPESFMSCSHGSGRLMSRTKAQETLNLEEEIKKMQDKGIIHGMRSKNHLDECASAYKDIDEVMLNQRDLVEILVELTPVAVIKGD